MRIERRNFTKRNSAAMFGGRKILSDEILRQILRDRERKACYANKREFRAVKFNCKILLWNSAA